MTEPRAASAAPSDPPAELVTRFKAALDRLWPEGGQLGLAVSGGPDSLAMLLLAEAAIPARFEVATVNHGLRPEAADECATVASVCAERGIECRVLSVSVAGGNVQAMARVARYEALGRWAQARRLARVATAHHADDQAETLLMRLNRGSGLTGLAGVRPAARIGEAPIIRPLLQFRRKELAAVVAKSPLIPVQDPSNDDPSFDRVRIRQALADAPWLDPMALARSAELLAEADILLADEMSRAWNANVTTEGGETRYYPGTSRFENIETTHHVLQRFGGHPRKSDVALLVDRLCRGENASLAGVLAKSLSDPTGAGAEGRVWTFRPEPSRRKV